MNEEVRLKAAIQDINFLRTVVPASIVLSNPLAPGGQGFVYSGMVDGRRAAIKFYYPGQLLRRIQREINALASLNSDRIVRLLWSGDLQIGDISIPVVATTLIEGVALSVPIRQAPLSDVRTAAIVLDVANAIQNLWEKRIVHRDLKPNNILIRPDGSACVIDLGVARHINETSLTQVGLTWGTQGYMSPEQSRCERQLTCKSDIYALAIIAVECGIGRHPTDRVQQNLYGLNLHQTLPLVVEAWGFADVLKSMLSPRATQRPLPAQVMQMMRVRLE